MNLEFSYQLTDTVGKVKRFCRFPPASHILANSIESYAEQITFSLLMAELLL